VNQHSIETVIKKLHGEQRAWASANEELSRTCDDISGRLDVISADYVIMKDRNERLTKTCKDQSNEIEKASKEIERILNELNSSKDENRRWVG